MIVIRRSCQWEGTTILGRIMDGLAAIDVSKVTVVTGYRAEDVERFLRERFPKLDLRLVHNPRYRETNNIVSLSMALKAMSFDADVVLIECDLLFDPSLLDACWKPWTQRRAC